MKGYKIFFSSTSLSLKSKPIAGLKINRKPVVGFNQKNCQLFSGRGKQSESVQYATRHIFDFQNRRQTKSNY